MNFYRLTLLFFCLHLLVSCSQNTLASSVQKSPEDALRAYYMAINELNLEKAALLATPETVRQLQLLGVYLNMSSQEEIEVKKKELIFNVKTLSCTQQGPKALCKVCCSEGSAEIEIELILENDKWFVSQHLGMTDQGPKQ
jgi:hypothetical protein